MANRTSVNCGSLDFRTSFPSYIASIRNATADDFTLVAQCKAEICNALWGSGNPDISGVGVCNETCCDEQDAVDKDVKMIVGYIIENVVGLILASLLYIILGQTNHERRTDGPTSINRSIPVLRRGCSCFYDCAVFFTFSI